MPRAGRNLLIECADEYNERVVFNLSPHLLAFARWVPTPRAAVPLLAAPLLLAALSACGEDHPPPPTPTDMMITFDAGDGGQFDAGRDDGGPVDPDATVPDDGGGGGPCHLEGMALKLASDEIDHTVRLVDVAVSGSTFLVGWTDARSAVADAYVYAWPEAAAMGAERRITDDFAQTRDVQLAARADGFVVGWVDNTLGSYEAFTVPVDLAGGRTTTPSRLTNNALREDSFCLTELAGGRSLAAWLESDGAGGPTIARGNALDPAGVPLAGPHAATTSPLEPTTLALSALGTGAALAWNDAGTVYLHPIDSGGSGAATTVAINVEGNANGTPALALDETGGAVVFGALVAGARAEIRIRTVGPTGATVGSETILTPSPATGAEPSVAAYATGYVIAYRSSAADGTGSIQLAFATGTGEFSSRFEVATTTAIGGAPRVAVAADGRIMVAWMMGSATGAAINAAKVICE